MAGGWLAAYVVRAERPDRNDPEVQEELQKLAEERGLGERLELHGGIWGTADVVVAYPRQSEDCLLAIDFDPDRYPALARACEFRYPDPEGR